MPTTQIQQTAIFPVKRPSRVNIYRNAQFDGEITMGFNPTSLFANCEIMSQALSADMAQRENLLVDILVKAGIISDADAAAALAVSPECTAIEYVRIFCHKSAGACDAFVTLLEKVWGGRISLNQAVVAANHVYTSGASVAEAVRLVKWAGR
jgi:hypothetical protein